MYIAHHTGYENDFVFWNDGMGCMTMDFKEGRLFDRCHDYLQGVGLKVLLMLDLFALIIPTVVLICPPTLSS